MFQRINRTDADKVFMVAFNVAGATVSAGAAVVMDSSASVDGVRVTTPATATLSLLVGVAAEAILDSAYGKLQAYGYNSAVYVTNDTSVAVAAGDILIPVDSVRNLARSAASDGKTGFVYAVAAVATATTPAAAQVKVFLRCL